MLKPLLLSVIIIAISVVLLSVGILFKKKGKFPNTHVSANPEMRKRGIHCAQSQHREAQQKNPLAVDEIEKQ